MFQIHLHFFIFITTLAHATICPCPSCEITSQPAYPISSFLLPIISFWPHAHFELGLYCFTFTDFRLLWGRRIDSREPAGLPSLAQPPLRPYLCHTPAQLQLHWPYFCPSYSSASSTTGLSPLQHLPPGCPADLSRLIHLVPGSLNVVGFHFHLSPGVTLWHLRPGEC